MLKSSRLLLLCRSRQSCSRFSTGKSSFARFRRKSSDNSEPETSSSRINTSQPGIGARMKIIKESQPDIEDMELDEEDIEEMEYDFLDSREILKKHEREMQARNFKIGLKITERKFFKQPVEPNLLSWSEKEQIRNLHSEDRVIWTVEKLAESFPATEDIIAKVLKATWKPSDVAKVRKHDEKAADNWRKWYAGELTIHNQNLREHLKKFNRRNFLPNSTADYSSYAVRSLPEPNTSEFSSIIESYKQLKLESEGNNYCSQIPKIEKYETKKVAVRRLTSKEDKALDRKIRFDIHTLDTLRMDVAKRMERDGSVKKEEREIDRQLIKKYVDEENKRQEFDVVSVERRRGEEEEEEEASSKKNWRGMRGIREEEEGEGRSVKEGWTNEGNEKIEFLQRDHEEVTNKTGEKVPFAGRNLAESRKFDRKDFRGVQNSSCSSQKDDEKIIEFKSADSEIENRKWGDKSSGPADFGAESEKSRTSQKSADLEVENRIGSGKSRSISKSADLETVNLGEIRSNAYESQFNAQSKYPPARFNKEGEIIWRPEKKHAVDDITYRIRIPKDKIKKGYLYKVKDCFYTHEGEFLYRVPGMT